MQTAMPHQASADNELGSRGILPQPARHVGRGSVEVPVALHAEAVDRELDAHPGAKVLLIVPPTLDALRQHAARLQQQRRLPAHMRRRPALDRSHYCLDALPAEQRSGTRLVSVGPGSVLPGPAVVRVEAAALAAEQAACRGEPQPGSSEDGIEVPLCMVPSLAVLGVAQQAHGGSRQQGAGMHEARSQGEGGSSNVEPVLTRDNTASAAVAAAQAPSGRMGGKEGRLSLAMAAVAIAPGGDNNSRLRPAMAAAAALTANAAVAANQATTKAPAAADGAAAAAAMPPPPLPRRSPSIERLSPGLHVFSRLNDEEEEQHELLLAGWQPMAEAEAAAAGGGGSGSATALASQEEATTDEGSDLLLSPNHLVFSPSAQEAQSMLLSPRPEQPAMQHQRHQKQPGQPAVGRDDHPYQPQQQLLHGRPNGLLVTSADARALLHQNGSPSSAWPCSSPLLNQAKSKEANLIHTPSSAPWAAHRAVTTAPPSAAHVHQPFVPPWGSLPPQQALCLRGEDAQAAATSGLRRVHNSCSSVLTSQPLPEPATAAGATAAAEPSQRPAQAGWVPVGNDPRASTPASLAAQQLGRGGGAAAAAVAADADADAPPWAEAERRGDAALAELLRLTCSARAAVSSAVVRRELPLDELQQRMSALLPFLAARQVPVAALEASGVAEVAVQGVRAVASANSARAAAAAAALALGSKGPGHDAAAATANRERAAGEAAASLLDQTRSLWGSWGRSLAASVLEETAAAAPRDTRQQADQMDVEGPPTSGAFGSGSDGVRPPPRVQFFWGSPGDGGTSSSSSDSEAPGGGGGGVPAAVGGPYAAVSPQEHQPLRTTLMFAPNGGAAAGAGTSGAGSASLALRLHPPLPAAAAAGHPQQQQPAAGARGTKAWPSSELPQQAPGAAGSRNGVGPVAAVGARGAAGARPPRAAAARRRKKPVVVSDSEETATVSSDEGDDVGYEDDEDDEDFVVGGRSHHAVGQKRKQPLGGGGPKAAAAAAGRPGGGGGAGKKGGGR